MPQGQGHTSPAMPLPVTLYTVSAVVILDSAGERIYSKYYDHATEFVSNTRKQQSFEKSIHEKTRKQNNQVALVDSYVVLYKSAADVTFCVVGRSEDSNELMLYGAIDTIFEALSEIIKPQLDKKSILEQYDIFTLTIDEVIDRGVIIETEASDLAQRMTAAAKAESSSTTTTLSELKGQGLSSAFNFAKQHLARTILKH